MIKHASMILIVLCMTLSCGLNTAKAQENASLKIVGPNRAPLGPQDQGSLTISFDGYSQTFNYGQFSTPESIAAGLAAEFSSFPLSARPALCTIGVCAKAKGATIVFELESPREFGGLTITGDTSIFGVDQSGWPGNTVLKMGLSCSPSDFEEATGTRCTATLPEGEVGPVVFTVDGANWLTSYPDVYGKAVTGAGLTSLTAGVHLVQATYSAASGPTTSVLAVLTVQPRSTREIAAHGAPIYSFAITGHEANGNVTGTSDSVNGSWTYTYDALNRLSTSAQQGAGSSLVAQCWQYDSFGNRLMQVTADHPFSADAGGVNGCQIPSGSNWMSSTAQYDGGNRITGGGWPNQQGSFASVFQTTPLYDNSGNMTYDLQNEYLYTPEGNICAIRGPSISGVPGLLTGYLYDAGGVRVAKGTLAVFSCDPTLQVNGQSNFSLVSSYIQGPNGEEMTELDSAGHWVHTNVEAAGNLIAVYQNDGQGIHFQLSDWLGTKRVQTSYSGVVEDQCTSQPFGDGLTCNSLSAEVSIHHFTGKERDGETGLDYFGARYFSSTLGRFMSADWSAQQEPVPYAKLDNPQSLNLYSYVENNPVGMVDADGHVMSRGLEDSFKEADQQAEAAAQAAAAKAAANNGGTAQQQNSGEGSTSNAQKREALAAAAGDQYHKTDWNPKGGYSQCNVFVCAMLDKVGLNGPRNSNGHAITAGQWADPKFGIDNWRVLGANEAVGPGDVAAVRMPGAFSNASGHMGIVSDLEGGVPHIMAAGSQHVYRTSAANFEPNYTIVYRRYVGP